MAAAASAAVSPAPPVPSTTTSTSWSQDMDLAIPSAQQLRTTVRAASITASLPRSTTSSRCEIRLMQVGGEVPGGVHRDRQAVGVRLDLAVGHDPALLAGLGDQTPARRARRHARQQRDPGRAAVQRVAAALVEGQLVGDLGRARSPRSPPADRPRRPAATPWCRARRPVRAGSAGSAGARCGRTTRRARPGPPPTGSGRPRPWRRAGTGQRAQQPVGDGAVHADLVGDLLHGQTGRGRRDQLQCGEPAGQGLGTGPERRHWS